MSTTFYPHGINDSDDEYSLNISYSYAHVPLHMMGLGHLSDTGGKLRVEQLEAALARAEKAPLEPHICADLIDGNSRLMGRSRETILYYRTTICKILKFCIERRVPLVWG